MRGPNAAPTTLVVTITGTNDAPEITHVEQHIENAQNQKISGIDTAEVDTTHVVGQITARDIDNGDELSLAYKAGVPTDSQGKPLPKEFLDSNGHLAGLTVDGHGGYTFILIALTLVIFHRDKPKSLRYQLRLPMGTVVRIPKRLP